MAPYNLVPNQPQINKIYNISLSDPLGNHSYINKIYEDVLPSEKTVYSFLTLNLSLSNIFKIIFYTLKLMISKNLILRGK
jgi:hypothetical protein